MDQKILEQFAQLAERMPKKDNLVVFAGRVSGRLMDNVKYAFLHCVENCPELVCYFLTFDKAEYDRLRTAGLPVLLFPSEGCVEILARASIVVSDDFWWKMQSPAYPLLHKARTVQLWHGIPLKKIGFPEIESSVNMTPEKADYLAKGYSGYNAVLSTSAYFTEHAFAKAFKADEFLEFGYPRNDVLLREPGKNDLINVDVEVYRHLVRMRKKGGRIVFYMPTFRDTGTNPLQDGTLDLNSLSEFCVANDITVVCKFHPYVNIEVSGNLRNVIFVSPQSDAYPLVRLADIMVTDYSSIYFDYLLLNKPIIFFTYDHEAYITRNRELLLDFDAFTPGPKVHDQKSLQNLVLDVLAGNMQYAAERSELSKLSFTHHDSLAGERLGKYLLSMIRK